jgi:hypothetical protein
MNSPQRLHEVHLRGLDDLVRAEDTVHVAALSGSCFPERAPHNPSSRSAPCARLKDLLSLRAGSGRTAIEVQTSPRGFGGGGRGLRARWGRTALAEAPQTFRLAPKPHFSPLRTQFVRGGAGGGASRGRSPKPLNRDRSSNLPQGFWGEVGEVYEPGGGAPRLPKHLRPSASHRSRISPLSARSLCGEGPGEGPLADAARSL